MPSPSPTLAPRAAESLAQLGARLRERRKELKVSAMAAAEAAGLSRVTLHRIENGFPSVTAGAIAATAAAIGLRLELGADERNQRSMDRASLSEAERDVLDALRRAMGGAGP